MSLDEPTSPARTVPCRPWTAAPLAILSVVGGASFASELASGQWPWAAAAAVGALSWGTLLVGRLAAHVRLDSDLMSFRAASAGRGAGRTQSSVDYRDVVQIHRTSVNRFGFDVRVTTRDGHSIPVATNILAGRASALVEAIEVAVGGGRRKPVLGLDRRSAQTSAMAES